MGRRINVYMHPQVYLKWKKEKALTEKDLSLYFGKPVRLTMPKFMNAVLEKHKTLVPFIPFNKKQLYILSRKKRGEYEL